MLILEIALGIFLGGIGLIAAVHVYNKAMAEAARRKFWGY